MAKNPVGKSNLCLAADVSTAEELLDRAEKDYKLEMEDRRWQYAIPDDILWRISDFLPLADFVTFRSVCRSWRNAPSLRSSIFEFSLKDVWCILYDFDARDRDMCLFYQVGNRKSCTFKLPNLCGATCLASKHRWLLIRRSNDYLFFHPLTLEEIRLPPYPAPPLESAACQVGTFIFVPTSTDCDVVLVSSRDPFTIEIAYCHLANKEWLVNKANVDAGDVAMGCTLLPGPSLVVDFSSYYNLRRSYIAIYYKTHFLSYDITEKIFHAAKLFPTKLNFNHRDWYSELMEEHSDDWLSKFGGEVSLSFSLFSESKRADSWLVFGTEAQAAASASAVKATWI